MSQVSFLRVCQSCELVVLATLQQAVGIETGKKERNKRAFWARDPKHFISIRTIKALNSFLLFLQFFQPRFQ